MATKQLKKKPLTCCGCHKTSEDVQLCTNPYSLDINAKEVELNLCDLCYQTRVEDI